jgi:hypothetical protein
MSILPHFSFNMSPFGMRKCVKQLCVNRLSLPHELIDMIKGFAFYDRNTYDSILNKNKVSSLIQHTIWSRKALNTEDSDGHWCFWIEEDPLCAQFQGTMCVTCGQYKFAPFRYDAVTYSQRIICQCLLEHNADGF